MQQAGGKIEEEVARRVAAAGLVSEINIGRMFCFRMCGIGPNMILFPDGDVYNELTAEKLDAVLPQIFERAHEQRKKV